MRHSLRTALLRALVLLPTWTLMAQVDMPRVVPEDYSESLFLDPLAFAGQGTGEHRLDVYLQAGYDNFSFVKDGDLYTATYEITMSILDSAGTLVTEKSWQDALKGLTFDQSVSSSAYIMAQRSFSLPPGRYSVTASLRDLDSRAVKRTTAQCVVPDFSSSILSMSNIMLISRLTIKDGKKSILPSVSPNVGNLSDAFYVFFEVYNHGGTDSLWFDARIYDRKKEVYLETDTLELIHGGRNEVFMRILGTSLPLGDYVLVIRAFPRDVPPKAEEGFIAYASHPVIIRWKGLPRALKDIDMAIAQLQYIAKESELSELKAAQTLEEKQKKFMEFWKKRDPNPNTPRNERMEQYYARVDYANKHFSHLREGWRTDMGMVYIVLGPPSSVDRHPFEVDSKPYEIWFYFDINYQYVFVDETGFGDYRLITPLWEVFNRRRE